MEVHSSIDVLENMIVEFHFRLLEYRQLSLQIICLSLEKHQKGAFEIERKSGIK